MKFVVFGEGRLGLAENGQILDLSNAPGADTEVFSSLGALIDSGARGLDLTRAIAERARGSDEPGLWTDIAETSLRPPFPGRRFALAGVNSAEHVASCFTNMGTPRTAEEVRTASRLGAPSGFWAAARPVMGPGAAIEIPARANGYFDYEGEPAVVLGKAGRDIRAADFRDHLWGFTLVIDWSIREPVWPPNPPDPLMLVKNFDCSKSIGPCVVVDEVDVDEVRIETLVNGEVRQQFSTAEMIFSFAEILEHLSRDFTVYGGDVISGGTGAGTAVDQTVPAPDGSWPLDLFLAPGDRVEVRSDAVGSLTAEVVPKRA